MICRVIRREAAVLVCPVCKIDTKTDTENGKLVLICRNPQCSNYKQVVKEVK
mgnify:CR=1 FL=1